jgi:hypothetical protein
MSSTANSSRVIPFAGNEIDAPAASAGAMKARQCAKIAELRDLLIQGGWTSVGKQASVLGLSRSTTWAVLQGRHKSSGLSAAVIKRMLRSPGLPATARQWIEEYVADKLAGKYGHAPCWSIFFIITSKMTCLANTMRHRRHNERGTA